MMCVLRVLSEVCDGCTSHTSVYSAAAFKAFEFLVVLMGRLCCCVQGRRHPQTAAMAVAAVLSSGEDSQPAAYAPGCDEPL